MTKLTCIFLALCIACGTLTGCAEGKKDSLDSVGSDYAMTVAEAPDTEPEPETIFSTSETEGSATTPLQTEAITTSEAPDSAETIVSATTSVSFETTVTTTFVLTPVSGDMYAVSDVNVRCGPGAEYDRVGHLNRGDRVEVVGLSDNGWYEIKFKDGEYFVKDGYLNSEKPAETEAKTTTVADLATTAATAAVSVATTTTSANVDESSKDNESKKTKWVATWGTAMLTAAAEQTPTNPSLPGNTVRQQIRVSIGGEKLRLLISNEFGESDLKIESIKISKLVSPKKPDVDLDTEAELKVDGKTSFTIGAGKKVTTDVLDYEFDALSDLAITMKLGSVPSTLTCHTASRCSTWVVKDNHVSDNSYNGNQEMTAWYFIAELDTLSKEESGAIVCLGDSLTDGASVTTNAFSRYTDELARKLQADEEMSHLAVVNRGIGATALYTYGNDSGKKRFQRDVLDTAGVKYLVLLYGVNDIGGAQTDISTNIINEYKSMIKKAHDNGIKVYGCTLTPFKGNGYYSELHEKIRLEVNRFVMSEDSGFDGYIDLSKAVASSTDSAQMDRKYVSVWNDYLHFNDSGYKHVGQTVYNRLKEYGVK